MTSEPINPEDVMAEHDCTYDSRAVEWCCTCYCDWPCLPYRLAEALAERDRRIESVIRAWLNPGRNPSWHRAWQTRLREEWPVLARALAALTQDREPDRA